MFMWVICVIISLAFVRVHKLLGWIPTYSISGSLVGSTVRVLLWAIIYCWYWGQSQLTWLRIADSVLTVPLHDRICNYIAYVVIWQVPASHVHSISQETNLKPKVLQSCFTTTIQPLRKIWSKFQCILPSLLDTLILARWDHVCVFLWEFSDKIN